MEPPAVFKVPANVEGARNDAQMEGFKNSLNKISDHVAKLEQKVLEIEKFYSDNNQEKQLQQPRSRSPEKRKPRSQTERMQDLIRKFGGTFNKIIQTLDSVDVDDLPLHHFSETRPLFTSGSALVIPCFKSAIGKPKDFNSIRRRIKAKDGSGYKHVRHIYYDVRSILKDALKYNDAKSNAHVTAKNLMAMFEENWIQFLPKVAREERRIVKEEGPQVFHARLAKGVSNELNKADMCLNNIRKLVLQRRCRKMSMPEKIELGRVLSKLSTDDLMRALEIVAEGNPAFQATGEELELDLTAQSESTLWRLKYFVVKQLKAQTQGNKTVIGGDKNAEKKFKIPATPSNLKRKKNTPSGSGKPPMPKRKKVGPTV